MQDMDSAVGRLDDLLMTVYVIIAALIIAVALEAQLLTIVTGAGTLILGMSERRLVKKCHNDKPSLVFLFCRLVMAHRRQSSRSTYQHHIPLHQASVRRGR